MPVANVVLDCNEYRSLSDTAFDALRLREKAVGIRPLASYYVALELLANLAPASGENHTIALASLRRLWTHTHSMNGTLQVMNFGGDADDQLSMILFDRTLPDAGNASYYGELIGHIASSPASIESIHSHFGEHLTAVHESVDAEEQRFSGLLWEKVIRRIAPEAVSWFDVTKSNAGRDQLLSDLQKERVRNLAASVIVHRCADRLQLKLSENEIAERAAVVSDEFAMPVTFYLGLVEGILRNGKDMRLRKRANSLWDLQICFATGRSAHFDASPVILVTDDGEILRAAEQSGLSRRVMKRNTYERLLDLGPAGFVEISGRHERPPQAGN